jgi:ADP-ribose pyrophosphatase YjhB (NUDIX family)
MTAPYVRIRAAAIIVEDGRILLVRHLKDGHEYWLLPGGGVDPGETLKDALCRELREEIDLAIVPGELALISESIAPDTSRHMVQLAFLAERSGNFRVTGFDPRVVGVEWKSIVELAELEMYPAIQHELATAAKTGFPDRVSSLGNVWK